MEDANLLSITDATGASIWHPRGLTDLLAIPERTLTLWRDMRDGVVARNEPWVWWRIRGVPTAHLYEASPVGVPLVSRCGQRRDPGHELVRDGDRQCPACSAVTARDARPQVGWGRIGDTILGPDGHPIGGDA